MPDVVGQFWQKNWGYVLFISTGVLCASAGYFQPIPVDGFGDLVAACAGILFFITAFLSLDTAGLTSFFIVFGFGGFLCAMYGLGLAMGVSAFGWALLALVAAILLLNLGVLGVVTA